MNENFELFLIAAAILTGLATPLLVFRKKGSRQVLTGHAVVLSRRTEYAKAARGIYGNNWNYRAVFQVGNQVLDLFVSQSQFPQLKEGLTGQLTWQYENLMDFVPDEG